MRLHLRRLRHFVWVALFAWVFALAAGVANACIVALPGSAPAGHENHRHVHERVGHDPVSAELTGHEGDHTGGYSHELQVDPGKSSCLKFCDDGSSALSKSGSPWFDLPLAYVPVGGFEIQPALISDARERLSLERPAAQGPPLVIRLLRLTL